MNWVNLDGKELIYCDEGELEHLVEANLNIHYRSNTDCYRVVCPRCYLRNSNKGEHKYNKRNLSIDKNYQIGHCFRCEGIFIDRLSGANHIVDKSLSIFDTDRYNNSKEFVIERINTSIFNDAIDIIYEPEARKYISERNPFYNVYLNQFKLRYRNNKLIIPYFNVDNQEIPIYYQFRYIDVSKSPTGSKYFNPPIESKPIYIALDSDKRVVWKAKNTTILVEGAMTAIALKLVVGDNINVVALMGKYLTSYQARYLKWLGILGPLYVMMDEASLSEDLAKSCSKYGLSDCYIIPSTGNDAEELLLELGMDRFRELINSYTCNSDSIHKLTFTDVYRDYDNTQCNLNENIKINWSI